MSSEQTQLKSFGFDEQPKALELLEEGFPEVSPAVWRTGFARMRQTPPPGGSRTIGSFILANGTEQGLSLAITRQIATETAAESVTNLSSWYMRRQQRHRAIWMARQMAIDSDQTYTDFSPTAGVARILELIGFRLISSQTLLIPTPSIVSRSVRAPSVLAAKQTLDSIREPVLQAALYDHLQLGCHVIGVEDALGVHPMVFVVKRRLKLVKTVQLIYTGSTTAFVTHLPAIGRYFLMRGVMLIEAQVPDDAALEAPCVPYFKRRYVKGAYPREVVDQLYSEAVYFPF